MSTLQPSGRMPWRKLHIMMRAILLYSTSWASYTTCSLHTHDEGFSGEEALKTFIRKIRMYIRCISVFVPHIKNDLRRLFDEGAYWKSHGTGSLIVSDPLETGK